MFYVLQVCYWKQKNLKIPHSSTRVLTAHIYSTNYSIACLGNYNLIYKSYHLVRESLSKAQIGEKSLVSSILYEGMMSAALQNHCYSSVYILPGTA